MTRPTSSVLTATWRVACVSEQQVTATRLFFRYTSPAKSTRSASSFERLLWPTFPYPLAPRRRCAAPAWPVAATLAGCGPMQDPARSLGAGCVRCQGRYPRGPRLDVLWSSLPKRERVLLRRYGRKVRSDRGDCQIGPLRRRSCMTEVKHYKVETNGIRMHVAEKGRGPLVVSCHGFPESWYSWRHQLRALADAGFRAVAPDITLSGDGPDGAHDTVPRGKGFLSRLTNPSALPIWVSEGDVDFYAGEFKRTGFRGGLNYYRCELGASRALRWCAGGRASALYRRRSRSGGEAQRHGSAASKSQ